MKEMNCLRCGGEMALMKREKVQLGQTGWIFGDWPNLLAGALDTEIYICKECSKLEFFLAAEEPLYDSNIPQKACPKCGKLHDIDYPKCPYCKHDYREE